VNTEAKHLKRGESSAPRGWLSSFVNDLSGESAQASRRRLLLGLALALAIIEAAVIAIPKHSYALQTEQIERITFAKVVRIEHRATPTPKPTPKPIVHTKVVAQTNVQPHKTKPAAPAEKQPIKRVSSARPLVRTKFHSKPVQHVAMGGHGAGTSKTAKATTGSVGTGGTGTGESGNGPGTGGAPAAHEPCGEVDFSPNGTPTTDRSGRIWEYVALIVHFPDGSEQSVDLDYPFFYNSEAEDPFIKGHDNIPATFQFPPSNQAPNEPPLVQYVIQHTSGDGYTLLHDCPK
jgi:hypothetical protein